MAARVWEYKKQGRDQKQNRQDDTNDGWIHVNRGKKHRPNIEQRTGALTKKVHPNLKAVDQLATSVYVTNIPWKASSKDVWEECKKWGSVIDVFIPAKLSQAGVRFGFVRFNRVRDVVKLISNLRTVWMGSFHLFADVVRNARGVESHFDTKIHVHQKFYDTSNKIKSYAEALSQGRKEQVNGNTVPEQKKDTKQHEQSKQSHEKEQNSVKEKKVISLEDDDCLAVETEQTQSSLLAKVVDVQVIQKLHSILKVNGFTDFAIRYIGGRWVWVELESPHSLASFKSSVEIIKLFSEVKNIDKGFILDERVVWIDIVGVPLVAWTPKAFKKIGAICGEGVFVDFDRDQSMAHGKVCVITKNMSNIQEEIRVEIKGISFDISIREAAQWAPDFESQTDSTYSSGSNSFSIDETMSRETLDFQKEYHETTAKEDIHNGFDEINNGMSEGHMENTMKYESGGDEKKADSDPLNALRKENIDVGRKEGADIVDQHEVISKPPTTEVLSTLTDSCSSRHDYDGLSTKDAVPDTQSGIHAPVHQDIPTSPTPVVDNAESDSDNIWNYRDPTGKIHGPFSLAQLQKWGEMGCFPNDFKIWRISSTENESLHLLYALKRRATVNCTTNGSDIQKSKGSLKNSNDG